MDEIAKVHKISTKTLKKIVDQWESDSSLYETKRKGNKFNHEPLIPRTNQTRMLISNFVNSQEMINKSTYSVDVASYLIDKGILPHGESRRLANIRAVQRYLNETGFLRGIRKQKKMIIY